MDGHDKQTVAVYRAMRTDFKDLIPAPLDRLTANKNEDHFRVEVMRALVLGSLEESIFPHASESYLPSSPVVIRRHPSSSVVIRRHPSPSEVICTQEAANR